MGCKKIKIGLQLDASLKLLPTSSFILKCRRYGQYCSRGFQSTGEKATIFKSSVGTAHLNMTYMRRSYGTQLNFLDISPVD
jgi:hypothetical protein